MNKYLEKIAGVPITKLNLPLVAKSYVDSALNFATKQQAGKAGAKDLLKMTGTAQRFNSSLPKRLPKQFEKEQAKYLASKGYK